MVVNQQISYISEEIPITLERINAITRAGTNHTSVGGYGWKLLIPTTF